MQDNDAVMILTDECPNMKQKRIHIISTCFEQFERFLLAGQRLGVHDTMHTFIF